MEHLLNGQPNPDDNLVIDGTTISSLEVVKNLGVWIDSKLDFSTHINNTIAKANQKDVLCF